MDSNWSMTPPECISIVRRPPSTVISTFPSVRSAAIQTTQRGLTKGGLCQWLVWQKNHLIPWILAVTKQLSQTAIYDTRAIVSGRSFRSQKTPVPLKSMTSKSPLPIHANPIARPCSGKKKRKKCHINFFQMLHCGSVQTKFLTYFKGVPSLQGCLLLSLYHFSSFFFPWV